MSARFDFGNPVLGIDHGDKVIGLAISRRGALAEPLGLIHRKSKRQDFARLNEIIQREKVVALVVGLPPRPPHLADEPGAQQAKTLRWVAHLAAAVDLPIYLWDEGLSTMEAHERLTDAGARIPGRVDAHAAAVILQACLDADTPPGRYTPPEENPDA
ncbi:MAG: Holliday junction resolvase RuvX [Anaerolineales bacterium]